MRAKFFHLACLILLLLCGCQGGQKRFTLKGDVATLGDDTLLVYGYDEWYDKVDTLVARHGKFSFTFAPDTVTPLWVAFPNGHREVVFAEKGTTTTLVGDTASDGRLTITGGTQNGLLAEFRALTADTVLTAKELQHRADTFITGHPYDEVSVYLLQELFVRTADPSVSEIRGLMNKMSGNLQDNVSAIELKRRLNGMKASTTSLVLSNYHLKDTIGQEINTNNFRDTCMLITFWASWNRESRTRQEDYRALVDSFAGRPFVVLGVSLDNDLETWLRTVQEDSLTWPQGNGFQGWNLNMIKQLEIHSLPANVLLSPQRRVLFSNLEGETMWYRVREAVVREEERIKAAKKAEEERKKANKKRKK